MLIAGREMLSCTEPSNSGKISISRGDKAKHIFDPVSHFATQLNADYGQFNRSKEFVFYGRTVFIFFHAGIKCLALVRFCPMLNKSEKGISQRIRLKDQINHNKTTTQILQN